MYKKILFLFIMVFIGLAFVGCDNLDFVSTSDSSTNLSTDDLTEVIMDYDSWLNSDEAIDYNDDRKIDETDYEIYIIYNDYDYWRASDNALDYNGDRKINEQDYEIFRLRNNYFYWENSDEAIDLNNDSVIDENDFDIYINYDIWEKSDDAEDLNEDQVIDVYDFEIYQEFAKFHGQYSISNYVYDGPGNYGVGEDNNSILFSELGTYLQQIIITIDANGDASVNIPNNVREIFNQYDLMVIIDEAIENMTISSISPYISVIDTFTEVKGVNSDFTLYLDDIDNGFSTTYVISFFSDNPTITFDIIRVD